MFDPNNDDDMKNMITIELTEQCSITSRRDNKYIFIMLDNNIDYNKFTPMTSQTKEEMKQFFNVYYNKFKQAGYTAKLPKLDNEGSKELIKMIQDEDLNYQLLAHYDHCLILDERAIQINCEKSPQINPGRYRSGVSQGLYNGPVLKHLYCYDIYMPPI